MHSSIKSGRPGTVPMLGLPIVTIMLVVGAPTLGVAQNRCDAGKLKCMRSKAACLLKVHEKAVKTGASSDAVKLSACQLKFDHPVKGCVAKLEAKQNPAKPATVCSIVGTTALLEERVDDCVAAALAGVGSPGGPSTCDSGKLKCMRNKAGCILKVHEKAIKTGTAADNAKIQACQLKFDDPAKGCIAKLEAKQDAQKPATLCANAGDTAALEAIVDACVAGAVEDLVTCPMDVEAPEGLTAAGALILHQDVAGVSDVAESGDRFGAALAAGDLDGDGFDDLVVGVPGENGQQGAFAVFYGAPNGLFGSSRETLVQWSTSLSGCHNGTTLTQMGSSAVVGDYRPSSDGEEYVVSGWPINWLACTAPFKGFHLGWAVPGVFEGFAMLPGQSMSIGEFTGDGANDLMALTFQVLAGGNPFLLRIPGGDPIEGFDFSAMVVRSIDVASRVIVSGDFDDDPVDDVAIGRPADFPGGSVEVIYNPFTPGERIEIWSQDSPGMVGAREDGDSFGEALAVGDFNGDGLDDLMVGVPGEDAAETDQGAFHRIFGGGSGLTATGNQLFGAITVQAGARYGSALAAGRFDNADTAHELAVGAPFHDVLGMPDAGLVDIRFGSATTSEWSQAPLPGAPETGDHFGTVLAVGDFNGDGADDLAIGVPDEHVNGAADAGAVNVIYGTPSQCLP